MGNCIGKKSHKRNKHYQTHILLSEHTNNISSCESDVNENIQYTSSIIINEQEKFKSISNEDNLIMGFLFSKEKEQEISTELVNTSPLSSFSNSSFSSFSCHSTSFSSEDQIILSSSSSSSFVDVNPILSPYYSDQIDLSEQSLKNEIFSSFSRSNKDLFHQNIIFHPFKTLNSYIDEVLQQQFIQIHRQTKTTLIEHQQFQCISLKNINKSNISSFIFDEQQKLVYIQKDIPWNEFQSITCHVKNTIEMHSSCAYCSPVLSGSKLNKYFYSFLLANITYNLIQICFNEINKTNLFGYISKKNFNYIQQIIIDKSKLNYSYNLYVNYTNYFCVLRVQSWPEEIRLNYEKRSRLWPINIENLFDNTCFIRYNKTDEEISTNDQCLYCKKILSKTLSWTYTYIAIESQLVSCMSNEQKHFASILWNYLNGKTQGEISFKIFKHTLFYFFEKYSSDVFITSDLFSHISHFINFLLNCLQTKFIPHYFNSNYNLYTNEISINFILNKITYIDLKNSSIYHLPDSSLYLYQLIYLIQFQLNFLKDFHSLKTNLPQIILDIHKSVIKQLSIGVKTYKQQLISTISINSHCPLTLDCLYQYQEENVPLILDYLPLLRKNEPLLLFHSLWSIFIQYFNSLFDDLFIS